MADVPISLRLLLDTPLEEELYEHWLFLLETVLLKYPPPSSHLLICMTMMVHPDFANEKSLRGSCMRILSKTLALHGSRAFRQVLNFDPEQLGRHKRRRIRHTVDEINAQATEEVNEIPLAGSQSICIRFTDIWELFGCAYSTPSVDAVAWLQLTNFLVKLLKTDWDSTTNSGKDITKTILLQLLRSRDEKRIELKRILRNILVSPCEDYNILDPYERQENGLSHSGTEHLFSSSVFMVSMSEKRQLINLIYAVTQIPRLNVLHKDDLVSALANLLAPLSLWTTLGLLSHDYIEESTINTSLLLPLCNGLLFRLAAFPNKNSKGGERLVDWSKVYGWCMATSRSRDAIEATKVEFFKCTLWWTFLSQPEHKVSKNSLASAIQYLGKGLDDVTRSIVDDPPNYSEKREIGKQVLPTLDELQRFINTLKIRLRDSRDTT